MFSNKFIQRFLKACQMVVLTGKSLVVNPADLPEELQGNNYLNNEFFTLEHLKNNEQEFWEKLKELRGKFARIKPNLGHFALVDLENRYEDFTVITTSIDGLHYRAGNRNLIELYGNIGRNICLDCGHRFFRLRQDDPLIPSCPKCSGKVRPDIVLRGETVDDQVLKRAQKSAAECEVFISIGFEDSNKDLQALPLIAKANGAYLIEINEHETALSNNMNEVVKGSPAKLLTGLALLLEKV